MARECGQKSDGRGSVEKRGHEKWHNDQQPVNCVSSFWPLVEVDAGLQKGDGRKCETEQLNQAPIPPQRLV